MKEYATLPAQALASKRPDGDGDGNGVGAGEGVSAGADDGSKTSTCSRRRRRGDRLPNDQCERGRHRDVDLGESRTPNRTLVLTIACRVPHLAADARSGESARLLPSN